MLNRFPVRWLLAAACCLSLCSLAAAGEGNRADYATQTGLNQRLVVRDAGGFSGAGTGTNWVIGPAGDWRHSRMEAGRRVETAGKLSSEQTARLVDQLVRYDLVGLPRQANSMTVADGINVEVEFGEHRTTFYAIAGFRDLPKPDPATPAGRVAGIVAAVRQAIEPVGAFLVPKILSIDLALEKRLPPNLVVTATGEVPTPGHKAILTRVVYAVPPADGIQDYFLHATPPSGAVPQVISTVSASDTLVDYQSRAPWLRGVRIHGIDKGVRVKMLDE